MFHQSSEDVATALEYQSPGMVRLQSVMFVTGSPNTYVNADWSPAGDKISSVILYEWQHIEFGTTRCINPNRFFLVVVSNKHVLHFRFHGILDFTTK